MEKIYAGLDEDGFAKLFVLNKHGKPQKIDNLKWLAITGGLSFKVEPGEMLAVVFRKQEELENS
jgi:hypothetical protein